MRLSWKYKLTSGALQFTIFISVVIALLLAAVVLVFYTHRFFIQQSKSIVQNIQLTDTGISSLILQDQITTDTTSISIPEQEQSQHIITHLSQWGLFEKAFVRTTHRKKQFTKCALLGNRTLQGDRPALYLQEMYSPLVVVGNTKIEGDAMLPGQGVQPGNIGGNSYYGKQLTYGKVDKSISELPKLKYDYKQLFSNYIKYYEPPQGRYISLGNSRKIFNSFNSSEEGFYSDSSIVLKGVTIYGNIKIRSATKIIVKNTADLKDIILIAPVIEIEDGVRGNFQAIASIYIKVGKECQLAYPTALVLVPGDDRSPLSYDIDNKIAIDKGTVIRGSVCYFNIAQPNEDFKVNIFADETSSVKGEIYCEGNLELKGSVLGTVYTRYFVANEDGSIFVNHLYNGSISSKDLPEVFGGLFFNEGQKSVMKWMY
ncbi:MAG: hypothetical protein EOO47_10640 [Flavobacterium sp.]|nr:MAG: hypothetical protein EOO47_10640 [Flavobacterium sp.]